MPHDAAGSEGQSSSLVPETADRLAPLFFRQPASDTTFAILCITVYGIAFYSEILLRREVYVYRDLYPLFLGMDHLASVFGAAQWPTLWNPFEGLGRPFAADLQTALFYPPSWFLRAVPEPSASTCRSSCTT